MVELSLSELLPDSGSSNCSLLAMTPNGEASSIAASVPRRKRTTLNRKSPASSDSSRITNSSKTSALDSTGNAKDLTPYWNQSCEAMSRKLLSHTKTGCVGSDLNCLTTSQDITVRESWFSTTLNCLPKKNSPATSLPSSTCSLVAFMECGNILLRCRKIRIYLTAENRAKARRYCGLARYWFNAAIEYLRKPGTHASLSDVRKIQKAEHPTWAFDCPQRVREHAMSDACNAVKNAKAKFRRSGIFQQVGFRSRRDTQQGFGFDKVSVSQCKVFSRNLSVEFHASEHVPEPATEGTRLVCESGQYFLVIPIHVPQLKPETQRLPVVAIDPGVRSFISFYSAQGVGKLGDGDFGKVMRLCTHLDSLISRMSKTNAKSRARMKRAAARMRVRIGNLIDELHRKASVFLCKSFDLILIPSFETSQMVTKLRSKTARMMMSFAHFRFRSTLTAIAERYSATVRIVNEAYTSKTCSYCGTIHSIGSKKQMKCCGTTIDRDHNGARGIFLRALAAPPSRSSECVYC